MPPAGRRRPPSPTLALSLLPILAGREVVLRRVVDGLARFHESGLRDAAEAAYGLAPGRADNPVQRLHVPPLLVESVEPGAGPAVVRDGTPACTVSE